MDLKSKSVFKNFSVAFLLLLVVTAVFIPLGAANAGWLGDLVSFDIFSSLENFVSKLLTGDSFFIRAIYALIYQILNIGLLAVTVLVYFGAWLIDVFLDEAIYAAVLNMRDPTSAVSIGWTVVRDACNTFFILFLLLIAFSTILRIQTYNAKSLLPKLIISLFLINFSAVIAMMVIDGGQVFMFEIKSWMGAGGFSGAGGGGSPLTTVVDYFNNNYNLGSPTEKFLLEDVVGIAFAVAYSVILGLLYIMLALFLMVRIVMFVILVIMSPFAFFSIILPGMRKYTSEWWQSLVSHAIFGPVFLFFIYLSGKMAQSMQAYTPPLHMTEIDSLSYIIAILIPHVVALMMLVYAIPITQKLGVSGAKEFIGGTAGLGKIGIGAIAGAKLAGGLGKKAGGGVDNRIMKGKVSDWGRRKKEGVLKSRVLLGLGKGTALKSQAETERKKEENMKKIRVEFGEAKSRDLDLLHEKAKSKLATKEDRALFAETAVAQGKSGDKEYAGDIAKYMPETERTLSGKDLSEITDKNLVLATKTGSAQKDINSGAKTEEDVMTEKMDDLIKDGKAHEVQGLDNAQAAKIWHESQDKDQRKSSLNRMNKKDKESLAKGYMGNTIGGDLDPTSANYAADTATAYAAASTDDKEKDLEYKVHAVKVGEDLEKAFTRGGSVVSDDIEKVFDEFKIDQISKFKDDQLEKYGFNTNNSQTRALNRAGEQKKVGHIRESKEIKMTNNNAAIAASPHAARATRLRDENIKLQKDLDNINDMLTGDKY